MKSKVRLDWEEPIGFGMYKGKTYGEILKIDPYYLLWCLENLPGIRATPDQREMITAACEKQKK